MLKNIGVAYLGLNFISYSLSIMKDIKDLTGKECISDNLTRGYVYCTLIEVPFKPIEQKDDSNGILNLF